MTTFADRILHFFQQLEIISSVPKDVLILNPYKDPQAFALCSKFFKKYYGDNHERFLILGINPGRHGAGLTGIPFTDPKKLETFCEISNTLPKKAELSADFIYTVISAYGGPEKFYNTFYFSSVCPLGFMSNGKNLNYYDSKKLAGSLRPFIVESLKTTLTFGVRKDICFCLGEGQNFKFLTALNNELNFFGKVIPLAHPRFIMQYKRKHIDVYVKEYCTQLGLIHNEER